MDSEGRYRVAPIFDNGKSLLNCNPYIDRDRPIGENIICMTARPFSGSHKVMFEYFGKGFEMDFDNALDWIKD